MAQLLLLSAQPTNEVLPALSLLPHKVRTIPAEPAGLVNAPSADLILLDARTDLGNMKSLARILQTTGMSSPLLLVVTEGGLLAVNEEWGATDIILNTAGPAEVDARIRLAVTRNKPKALSSLVESIGIHIDETTYTAKLHGQPLDLTYKEFELLKFLTTHPGRVFSREQLLSEVWGYDYFGGTRTVDVHIRRLRFKLGDLESMIGTVRNRGYSFNPNRSENEEESVSY
jgi:DNA-binding response OmpR family regulator